MRITSKNPPYWNFWKVVFAGWLIRYPMAFVKVLFWTLIVSVFCGVASFQMLTDSQTDRREGIIDKEPAAEYNIKNYE